MRRTARSAGRDARALAPVELQPPPRLRDPGPVGPPFAGLPHGLRRVHRPPGRAGTARIAHRHELVVDRVGADRRLGLLDPLLDLLQERVDHLRPRLALIRVAPAGAGLDIPLDRLRVVPCQGGRRPDRLGQVVCLKDFHDLSVRLRHRTSPAGCCCSQTPANRTEGLLQIRERSGTPQAGRPSTWISGGRQPGLNWPHTWTLPRPPTPSASGERCCHQGWQMQRPCT